MMNHERLIEQDRNRRARRLVEGRCIRCSAPLIEDEVRYCFACMAGRRLLVLKGVFSETYS